MLNGTHVTSAVAACTAFLTDSLDADWNAPIPEMDWTVAQAVAHAAEGCLWYAIDLAAGGEELDAAVEQKVKPDAPPAELVATMTAHASVVAAVIDASHPDVRGFHPIGPADPSGFAGMACDELLVHTDDAARGLGLPFAPPSLLAEAVLRRLFPWVDVDADPWQLLLWANGRIALPDRPRLTGWEWHCRPLDDWDGTVPERVESSG